MLVVLTETYCNKVNIQVTQRDGFIQIVTVQNLVARAAWCPGSVHGILRPPPSWEVARQSSILPANPHALHLWGLATRCPWEFWLNVTIHSQSEIYMAVRQLEFSLLQLIQQVDELLTAIQCILGGRLPMTLVNPLVLHNILRNVSLQLPENHELIAGTNFGNIYYYYDLIKVTVVGNTHGMKIILGVPLKSAK